MKEDDRLEEEWLKEIKEDYPDIEFIAGYKEKDDENGVMFQTLVATGFLEEGCEFKSYYLDSHTSTKEFYKEFNIRAKGCSRIKVRQIPETMSMQVFFATAWSPSMEVDLRKKDLYVTTGRFIFLKGDEK